MARRCMSSIRTPWRAVLNRISHPLGEEEDSDRKLLLWVTPEGICDRRSDGCSHEEVIRQVLHRYATVLDLPFSFRTSRSHYSAPASPDGIHVHAFARPTPVIFLAPWFQAPPSPLPFAYGVPLREGAQWALSPDVTLCPGRWLADAEGRIVAACRGTNLYCLFDLLGQEPIRIPLLLRRHLDLGLPRVLPALPAARRETAWEDKLRLLREETAALVVEGRERLHAAAREAYISASWEGTTRDEIRFLRAEIAFLEAAVEEMGRRIEGKSRRLCEGRRRLRALQGGEPPREPPENQLAALQALPEVREAQEGEGCITIVTDPLFAEYEGRRYRLGVFRLDLHGNGDVRISNLSDRVGAFDHPRVCEGHPRLAGIREGVEKLLGESQLVAAAEVLIDFLKTVDPTDWRLPIQAWPEASHEPETAVLASP